MPPGSLHAVRGWVGLLREQGPGVLPHPRHATSAVHLPSLPFLFVQVVYLDEPSTGLDPISRWAALVPTAPAALQHPQRRQASFSFMDNADRVNVGTHAIPACTGVFAANARPPACTAICSNQRPCSPRCRRHLWDLIDRVKGGRAVVLTTHSMEEADILGDRREGIALRTRTHCLAVRSPPAMRSPLVARVHALRPEPKHAAASTFLL